VNSLTVPFARIRWLRRSSAGARPIPDILALTNQAMRLPGKLFLNVSAPELSNHCESDTRAWESDDL